MSKKLAIGIAAAVVVVAGGAMGTSYYMGGKLQAEFTNGIGKLNQHGVSAQVTSYERGLFSSTAKTEWTLGSGEEPTKFTAEHKISHGPLPMGHAAEIHTAFSLPADADAELKTALNGRAPVEVVTKVGWSRSSSNLMTSPAVVAKVKDSEMNWGGMKIEWDMPADMKAAKGTANFAGLAFKDEEGSTAMEKTSMRFDVKQPKDQQFWVGPFAMMVDKVTATRVDEDGKSSSSSFEGLSMDSDTTLKEDLVEMSLKGALKSAKLEDSKADDLVLDVVLRNIDAAWLNHFMEMAKRKTAAEGEDDDMGSDFRETLMKTVTKALARQPAIEIKRIAMRTPEGLSEFGAALQYLGDGENMSNPFQDLKVSLNANVPKPVLDSYMQSRKRKGMLALMDEDEPNLKDVDEAAKVSAQASIQSLKDQGIFEEKAGMMTTQIVYAKGEFQVNGKKLGDDGAAILMGEALE